uniref:AAA family ATPase n=2 Tax=Nitrobacteraceae TaxID=41294 RepID=UPI002226E716|nr:MULTISPECIES: ATP-binding protein [Bradyrhizobium]
MHKTKLPLLFGREEEIGRLLRRWRHAMHAEGRVVVLTGEPGIGKSHISLALDERLQSEPHITLRYFCSAAPHKQCSLSIHWPTRTCCQI